MDKMFCTTNFYKTKSRQSEDVGERGWEYLKENCITQNDKDKEEKRGKIEVTHSNENKCRHKTSYTSDPPAPLGPNPQTNKNGFKVLQYL